MSHSDWSYAASVGGTRCHRKRFINFNAESAASKKIAYGYQACGMLGNGMSIDADRRRRTDQRRPRDRRCGPARAVPRHAPPLIPNASNAFRRGHAGCKIDPHRSAMTTSSVINTNKATQTRTCSVTNPVVLSSKR